MEKPKTYLSQVFDGVLSVLAFVIGLLFIIFGLIARYKAPQYDFGGWLGLGDGVLLLLMGGLLTALLFGVPYYSKEKRAQRGL